MPLYDTQCTACGTIERNIVHASSEPPPTCKCGGATEHIWDDGQPRSKIFHKGWYEHLSYEPLYFDDRGKLREYCKRNDLIMDQLES